MDKLSTRIKRKFVNGHINNMGVKLLLNIGSDISILIVNKGKLEKTLLK